MGKTSLPEIIYAELSPISPVGISLFDMDEKITSKSVETYLLFKIK